MWASAFLWRLQHWGCSSLRRGRDAHAALLSTDVTVNAEQLFSKKSLLAPLCTGKDMACCGAAVGEGVETSSRAQATSCEMQMCIAALIQAQVMIFLCCAVFSIPPVTHLPPLSFCPLSLLCDVISDIGALSKGDAMLQVWAENSPAHFMQDTEQLSA